MRSDLPYKLLRAFVRFWVGFFFKEVSVRNAHLVPEEGPLLVALNHPNNLLDSVLIAAVFQRKIHFLATGQLFRLKPLAMLLLALGAIPVYRKQDGGDEEKNRQAFSRVVDTLHSGGVVAIYPEGITHSDPYLHKIKTGAARMALQSEAEAGFNLGLKIMPVGLNFLARKSFRRRVMINFGDPIEPAAYRTEFEKDERAAVAALTDRLQDAIEGQLLNIEQTELLPLIHEIEQIYKDYIAKRLIEEGNPERAEEFTLSRRIIEATNFYQRYYPEKFEALRDELLEYKSRRDYLSLPEKAFKTEIREGFSSGVYTPILIEGFLGAPIFFYGAVQNIFPYMLPRVISRIGARKETDYATIRFLSSMIAFTFFYLLQTAACVIYFGWAWGSVYLASLPVSGLYALRYEQGIRYFLRKIHILNLFMTNRRILAKLSRRRETIIERFNEVREAYLKAAA